MQFRLLLSFFLLIASAHAQDAQEIQKRAAAAYEVSGPYDATVVDSVPLSSTYHGKSAALHSILAAPLNHASALPSLYSYSSYSPNYYHGYFSDFSSYYPSVHSLPPVVISQPEYVPAPQPQPQPQHPPQKPTPSYHPQPPSPPKEHPQPEFLNPPAPDSETLPPQTHKEHKPTRFRQKNVNVQSEYEYSSRQNPQVNRRMPYQERISQRYEIRRPAIEKQIYDIEEKIVIRPAGSQLQFEESADLRSAKLRNSPSRDQSNAQFGQKIQQKSQKYRESTKVSSSQQYQEQNDRQMKDQGGIKDGFYILSTSSPINIAQSTEKPNYSTNRRQKNPIYHVSTIRAPTTTSRVTENDQKIPHNGDSLYYHPNRRYQNRNYESERHPPSPSSSKVSENLESKPQLLFLTPAPSTVQSRPQQSARITQQNSFRNRQSPQRSEEEEEQVAQVFLVAPFPGNNAQSQPQPKPKQSERYQSYDRRESSARTQSNPETSNAKVAQLFFVTPGPSVERSQNYESYDRRQSNLRQESQRNSKNTENDSLYLVSLPSSTNQQKSQNYESERRPENLESNPQILFVTPAPSAIQSNSQQSARLTQNSNAESLEKNPQILLVAPPPSAVQSSPQQSARLTQSSNSETLEKNPQFLFVTPAPSTFQPNSQQSARLTQNSKTESLERNPQLLLVAPAPSAVQSARLTQSSNSESFEKNPQILFVTPAPSTIQSNSQQSARLTQSSNSEILEKNPQILLVAPAPSAVQSSPQQSARLTQSSNNENLEKNSQIFLVTPTPSTLQSNSQQSAKLTQSSNRNQENSEESLNARKTQVYLVTPAPSAAKQEESQTFRPEYNHERLEQSSRLTQSPNRDHQSSVQSQSSHENQRISEDSQKSNPSVVYIAFPNYGNQKSANYQSKSNSQGSYSPDKQEEYQNSRFSENRPAPYKAQSSQNSRPEKYRAAENQEEGAEKSPSFIVVTSTPSSARSQNYEVPEKRPISQAPSTNRDSLLFLSFPDRQAPNYQSQNYKSASSARKYEDLKSPVYIVTPAPSQSQDSSNYRSNDPGYSQRQTEAQANPIPVIILQEDTSKAQKEPCDDDKSNSRSSDRSQDDDNRSYGEENRSFSSGRETPEPGIIYAGSNAPPIYFLSSENLATPAHIISERPANVRENRTRDFGHDTNRPDASQFASNSNNKNCSDDVNSQGDAILIALQPTNQTVLIKEIQNDQAGVEIQPNGEEFEKKSDDDGRYEDDRSFEHDNQDESSNGGDSFIEERVLSVTPLPDRIIEKTTAGKIIISRPVETIREVDANQNANEGEGGYENRRSNNSSANYVHYRRH